MITIENIEAHTHALRPTPWYRILYVQVIVAIVLGILLGQFWPGIGEQMKPLGDAFIKLVKMIIAPVIFLTVVTGIAGMTNMKSVGRVAGKAMIYFLTFSTLALLVGMVVANTIQPGTGLHIDPHSLDATKVSTYVTKAHDSTVTGFLLNIIPDTLVSPLVGNDILQVLFVAILFGIALAMVGDMGRPVFDFLEALSVPVFKLVGNLALLVGTFYLTSLLFVLVVLGLVAYFNGFSIIKLIRYIKDELLLVLGTSSSESALPNLMHKMEAAGCAKPVVGLVIPMGYSFNLDGTNIYMTLAALFIAQALDINLSMQQQILLLLVAMLSSKGAAGVTGAGFITLAATLAVVPDVPVAGMTLILGVDRFMSECRALTNFVGNAVATVVVSRWDGQLDRERLLTVLGNPTLVHEPALIGPHPDD